MPFERVTRSSLSNQVFAQLRDSILGSHYGAGQKLPSERELCEILGVNRSSVREALKRLEQARLIEIRHGEGSVVLDFTFTAGFDLMRDLVMPLGRVNRIAVRSILELRALIGPEVARLAALRIKAPELERVRTIVEQIEGLSPEDGESFQKLDYEFHYTMARGSQNLALLLILNSAKDIYLANLGFFSAMFPAIAPALALYRRIYDALQARDAVVAESVCREMMEAGNELFQVAGLFDVEDEAGEVLP